MPPHSYRKIVKKKSIIAIIKSKLNKISYIIFPVKHGDFDSAIEEFVANLPSSWVNLVKQTKFKDLQVTFPGSKERIDKFPGEIHIKACKRAI